MVRTTSSNAHWRLEATALGTASATYKSVPSFPVDMGNGRDPIGDDPQQPAEETRADIRRKSASLSIALAWWVPGPIAVFEMDVE